MLQKTSNDFRKFFLLEFTKELIKHSEKADLLELEFILKENKLKKQEKIKKIINTKKLSQEIPEIIFKTNIPIQKTLKIPEPRLPRWLQYMKPTATSKKINLDKLNSLINDPKIISIECNGTDKKVIVKTPQTNLTNINLSKKEIKNIIEKFSQESKIPVSQGVFKVVVGNLIFSAIISDIVDSKFIIRKIGYNQRNTRNYNQMPVFK